MTKKINPNLTAEQKLVLFEDGTEPPNTSELNNEKREGSYHCVGCGIKLFVGSSTGNLLVAAEKDIETDFWIESAQITIEKPETLIVSIIEFEPIYIWNKTTYVNKEGKQIKRNNTFIKNLLKLNSKTSQSDDMYKLYIEAQNILSQININITEIDHDLNTLDIITTRYRFFVNFDDFERKLREFVGIYDQFLSKSKKIQGIKNIDLRYPTGFAVH